ncbi:MAG TPA: hypothetical protein VGN00_14345 [Puia sp.]|jgi:antitoxin component of RelBE/YafQ-DinJ toxin-antitoxin module
MDPNLVKAIAQFLGSLGITIFTVMRMMVAKVSKMAERMLKLEEQVRHNRELIETEVENMKEKIQSERLDFKERLKEITDYMYNRPR